MPYIGAGECVSSSCLHPNPTGLDGKKLRGLNNTAGLLGASWTIVPAQLKPDIWLLWIKEECLGLSSPNIKYFQCIKAD